MEKRLIRESVAHRTEDRSHSCESPGRAFFATWKALLSAVCAIGLFLFFIPSAWGQGELASRSAETASVTERLSADFDESAPMLKKRVSVHMEDVSRISVLRDIARQGGLQLTYGEDVLSGAEGVTVHAEDVTVLEALHRAIENTGLDLQLSPSGHLIVSKSPVETPIEAAPQPILVGTITGTVTDAATGEPVPGVNVTVEGTQQGAATSASGEYTITGVEAGTYAVRASFIGYGEEVKEGVVVQDGETTVVDFAMQEETQDLNELVVVGYGEQRREDLTGSVASIDTENITAKPTANVAEAMQGQAAGVMITQSSGEPGSGMDVMIRGSSTLGSSDPLYVIDGIPTGGGGGLTALNSSNIESIEILKDASATAIYGSRAANGVVIIETKQGAPGDIQVQLSSRVGMSSIPEGRRLNMMDSREFYEFSVDAYRNAGLPIPSAWQEPNLSENLQRNTDWQGRLFEPGLVQDHNMTVSGGGENAVYSLSGGYFDEDGVVVSDGFNRASFRINSEYYIGGNDQLVIGEKIGLTRTKATGGIINDTFKETFQQSPTVPFRNPDNRGGFAGPTEETSPGFRLNQVALLHLEETENITQRLLGTTYAEYEFIPNLSYRLNLSADLSNTDYQFFSPLYDLNANVNTESDLDQSRAENRALIVENTLNYNGSFGGVHRIQALAGFTRESRRYEVIEAEANGFPSDNLRTINAATGQTLVRGGATASSLQSLLGRVQYGYDDRYQAQVAIRRDGSSRFGRDRRWGTFPSGSVGWSVHNESFMSGYESLSQLKLRGSWGVTGTQAIPDFAAIPTVLPVANYIFGEQQQEVSGAAVLSLGNSELQWQETRQSNIGLDLGFFDQRISFTLEYFRKNTSNVLLRVPVATTSGFWRNQGAFQNIGEIQNSGIELAASYQQSFGDVSLQANGNVSTVNNEVQSIGGGQIITTLADELGSGSTITRPGSEVGAFYGWIAEGPFRDQADVDNHATQPGAMPGDLKFRDLNDDGVIDSDDRTIIGSPFADFFYGFTMNLGYRGWGLRMQLDGVQGRDIFDLRADNDPKGFNNVTTDYLDRWTPDRREAEHPRPTTTDPNSNLRSSTYRVKDGSYLALRNVSLSYSVDPALLEQWVQVSNLQVFIAGNNVLWLTAYDGYNPEIGAGAGDQASLTRSLDQGSYPIARSLELGINLRF